MIQLRLLFSFGCPFFAFVLLTRSRQRIKIDFRKKIEGETPIHLMARGRNISETEKKYTHSGKLRWVNRFECLTHSHSRGNELAKMWLIGGSPIYRIL